MKLPHKIKDGYIAVAFSQVCLNGVYLPHLPVEGTDLAIIDNRGRALEGETNRPYRYRTIEEAEADVAVLVSSA